MVFSTLGGGLTAIDPITSEIRWTIADGNYDNPFYLFMYTEIHTHTPPNGYYSYHQYICFLYFVHFLYLSYKQMAIPLQMNISKMFVSVCACAGPAHMFLFTFCAFH